MSSDMRAAAALLHPEIQDLLPEEFYHHRHSTRRVFGSAFWPWYNGTQDSHGNPL